MLVLLCPLSGIIEPGVGEPFRQMVFVFLHVVDKAAEAAPVLERLARDAGVWPKKMQKALPGGQ